MARALSIAALLGGRGKQGPSVVDAALGPRPPGAVVWVRCTSRNQLAAVATLRDRLTEDGDPVVLVVTLPDWDAALGPLVFPEPQDRQGIRAFLQHWQPVIALWVRGHLDMVLLEELRRTGAPSILVDGAVDALDNVVGSWLPGTRRPMLTQFEAMLTIDQIAADRLIRAGAPQGIVHVTGAMEDTKTPLPCIEQDRRELAQSLGTRPAWLAAGARANDFADLSRAHRQASLRAHRLILIIVPAEGVSATDCAEQLAVEGFHLTLRSQETEPPEHTQVYIVDTDEGLGLWYRIAPITYLGGTLHGGGCRDPFEATALGSALLYGPQVAPFQHHATRLNAAGASWLIRAGQDLGPAVEKLLAADKAALLAHAAWDVTSRGADVTNRIVNLIQRRLDGAVG